MSERLTDDHLSLLERALANIDNDYRPTCESVSYGSGCPGATAESIDFWRRAVDALPSLIAELRQRRAADLSSEDVEALEWLAAHLALAIQQPEAVNLEIKLAALRALAKMLGGDVAVLDRLLAREEVERKQKERGRG